VRFVLATQIVLLHDRIVTKTGGSMGVREPGLLFAIEAKPQANFDQTALYPSIYDKVAATFEAICNYHVFVDGNKRTAIACLEYFLYLNNYKLLADSKEKERFVLCTASRNPTLEEIAIWIKSNSKKVK